jgi:hypothetical protein
MAGEGQFEEAEGQLLIGPVHGIYIVNDAVIERVVLDHAISPGSPPVEYHIRW